MISLSLNTPKTSSLRSLIMHRRRVFLLFSFFMLTIASAFGQDEDIFGITRKARSTKSDSRMGNIFRNVREQFSFQVSSGAAYYTLNSEFYKGDGQVYPITQYQNQEYGYFPLPDTLSLTSRQLLLPTVEAGLRLNLFNILTLGGGYGWENGRQAPFEGSGYQFSLQGSNYQATNYYASAGLVLFDASRRNFLLKMKYKKFEGATPDLKLRMQRELKQRVRQNYPWNISVEAEVGKVKVNQAEPLVPKVYQARLAAVEDQYTYAAALRIGYNLSEYASLFAKGKYMQRSFVNNSPDFTPFPMDQEVYSVQVGFAMKIPGTKRCKISGCGVVMNHGHDGVEYRGSSIFNLQNRRIGQWY